MNVPLTQRSIISNRTKFLENFTIKKRKGNVWKSTLEDSRGGWNTKVDCDVNTQSEVYNLFRLGFHYIFTREH